MIEGIVMSVSWIAVAVLLRWSRRPVRPVEILLIAVFSVLTIKSVRMIGWYAAVYGYCTLPHLADVVARVRERRGSAREPSPGTALNFAVCALIVWFGITFSPLASPLFGGEHRKLSQVVHSETPLKLTRFLHKFHPQGQIYNPQWWGDWLAWRGPSDLKPFMTTNAVHLAPHRLWKDYMAISQTAPGWQSLLDKYDISTIVVHKERQVPLDIQARMLEGWRIVYEDEVGLVVTREPLRAFERDPSPIETPGK
jgi:hypothetical protein